MTITVTIVVAGIVVMVLVIALWWLSWQQERRSWCVLFYLVGREPRSTQPINSVDPLTGVPPGRRLDEKLNQVISRLKDLPCCSIPGLVTNLAWTDVHVAYRALWDKIETPPVAEVVNWSLNPVPSVSYFPGEAQNLPFAVDLTDDLQRFFEWAYANCPADHYAVFFWGHSMGPAGLFEISEKPNVTSPPPPPPPSQPQPPPPPLSPVGIPPEADSPSPIELTFSSLDLEHFTDALDSLVERRLAEPGIDAASAKVEMVFFQDCWMSTLETAYELQDNVRYVVASQSVVPIGYYQNALGAVWPYENLINTFLNQQDFSNDAFEVLRKFFFNEALPGLPPNANTDYNSWKSVTLPFSLLDLGRDKGAVSAALTRPLQQLVSALDPIGTQGRFPLIEGAVKVSVPLGVLEAGDCALVDVLTLCKNLQNPVLAATLNLFPIGAELSNVAAAAQAVQTAIGAFGLIKNTFEWAQDPLKKLGFTGVSVLFTGGLQNYLPDPYIVDTVTFGGYAKFRFAIETNLLIAVPPQPPSPNQTEPSWTYYAING